MQNICTATKSGRYNSLARAHRAKGSKKNRLKFYLIFLLATIYLYIIPMFLTTIGKKEGRAELTNMFHKVKVRRQYIGTYTCTVHSVHWKNRIETEPGNIFGSLRYIVQSLTVTPTEQMSEITTRAFFLLSVSDPDPHPDPDPYDFWASRFRILPS